MIVALIPAHNESAGIRQTIKSLQSQTVKPDQIIVMADNCTDDTIKIALDTGVEVFETVNNAAKKAGALNQGLQKVLPYATHIVTLDADTVLVVDWIEQALDTIDTETGAVSGRYEARNGRGFISLLQKIEYEQVHRRVSRKGGYVHVLSGTATMFLTETLLALQQSRGYLFDETSFISD